AEQKHGLPGEEEEERYGEEIQESNHDAATPGVLGFTMTARVERDRDLGHREPAGVGQHDEEPMPIVAKVDLVQDLPAERLHRVQVRDRDVEEGAAQPIVDPRDRALLVTPDLAARDDVPPLVDLGEKARDLVGKVLEVRVVEHDDVALRRLGAREERLRLAAIATVAHDPEPVPTRRLGPSHLRRTVRRAVVHEDDFALEAVPVERRTELAD